MAPPRRSTQPSLLDAIMFGLVILVFAVLGTLIIAGVIPVTP